MHIIYLLCIMLFSKYLQHIGSVFLEDGISPFSFCTQLLGGSQPQLNKELAVLKLCFKHFMFHPSVA